VKPVLRHVLYRRRDEYASFPSLCARAGGGFWLAFRRAPDHRALWNHATGRDDVDHLDARSHIALLPLDAHGSPCGDVSVLPPHVGAADQDPNLLALRDGTLLLTGFAYYPLPGDLGARLQKAGALPTRLRDNDIAYFLWGAYARRSRDGAAWSAHDFFGHDPDFPDIIPGVRPWYGGALRGRALELADGTLLQATYGGRGDKACYASALWASDDRGVTWHKRATIAFDREQRAGFCESALVQLCDGSLLALHRTTGLDGRIATSRSRDLGFTWEDAIAHPVIGHPTDACALADGRLLVVYGYRAAPYGVRARLWDPASGPFDAAPELVLVDDAASPDIGYPWAVPLDGGGALVAFYCADQDGVRGIEAVRLGA
jgi:BNR repeat-like domain